ncbi:hypothetical protein PCL1606_05560 [Pseudomonas chlororaphis]|uniref:Uncharacterized protein n=1 Tax=Pseudomonas chlororaphis TaxID=587753 RepID=A0A0D5XSD8_9PSED|nr:hypothetical protein PCL1606_05560 [Pseudomonas chlororaphis]
MDVLQHRGFPCLGEGIRFAHNHYRSLFWICRGRVCGHGRSPGAGCPLDVSLGSGPAPAHSLQGAAESAKKVLIGLLEKNPTKCTLKACLAMSDHCARGLI